ncbi:MAG: radical SAM protein [bacterium]
MEAVKKVNKQQSKPRITLVTVFDVVSIGVRYLQSVLDDAGYECDLVLFRVKRVPVGTWPSEREYELLKEVLEERRPDVLGVSFRSFAMPIAERISRVARESVDPLVVWGGTHPTLAPEDCLEHADLVCMGEGEGALLDLAEALASGSSYEDIRNLCFKKNGELIKNPLRPLIQDLDSIPYPRLGNERKFTIEQGKLEERDVYLGASSPVSYFIIGCRGCPFNCDYCCISAFRELFRGLGTYVRKRSPENIIQEIEEAGRVLDIKFIGYMDEVFGMDPAWARRIAALHKQRVGLPFLAKLHPNPCDEEQVQTLTDAGMKLVVMGIQSGSDRSRRENYHRKTTDRKILELARSFHKHKLITVYDFIFDNPYETEQDLRETFEMALTLPRPNNLEMLSLSYFPGSRLTRRALEDGLITPDQVEGRAYKTFAGYWSDARHSLDQNHAFYSVLCWLLNIKFEWESFALVYISENGGMFHVLPRPAVRLLSRSRYLRKNPQKLDRLMVAGVKTVNKALVPARKARNVARAARSGRGDVIIKKLYLKRKAKEAEKIA